MSEWAILCLLVPGEGEIMQSLKPNVHVSIIIEATLLLCILYIVLAAAPAQHAEGKWCDIQKQLVKLFRFISQSLIVFTTIYI